jgi:hypothetical protein
VHVGEALLPGRIVQDDVHVTARGRGAALGLALALALAAAACVPRVAPQGPGEDPSAGGVVTGPGAGASVPAGSGGEPAVLGEMCREGADGGPGVSVVLARKPLAWSSDPAEVRGLLAKGMVTHFTVVGWSGKRAGTFTVAGPVDLPTVWPVALGGYAGAAPCVDEATEVDCKAVLDGCGLAVGGVGPAAADDPVEVKPGAACVQGNALVVDIDGDGALEAFALADFLDARRGPAEEVVAGSAPGGACSPRFAQRGIVPAGDPGEWRGLDLVGVLDVDHDGRQEIVLQLNYDEGDRKWAVYTASQMAARLTLVGVVVPWGT